MYNLQQQAFAVSTLSNLVGGQNGDNLQQLLATDITTKLQSSIFQNYIGNWATVWGPVVYTNSKDKVLVADNAMFAAQNQQTKDIVVGIAGTNGKSWFDMLEDVFVDVPHEFPGLAGAWVAQGTWDGVQKLEAMTDDSGRTLLAFLNSLAPTNANLIIAGHSLGGALTPVFALDLLLNQNLRTSNFSSFYTYPTAGPTPGNDAFANHFAENFPAVTGTSWQVWNQNVWNTLDAVPHAWNNLPELPALYAPQIKNSKCVDAIVTKLENAPGKLTYTSIPNSSFPGTFEVHVSDMFLDAACRYVAQALHQHIPAYIDTIIPDLASQFVVPDFDGSDCGKLQALCGKL